MKRYLLIVIAAVAVCLSCERRELLEPSSAHYVRVYLDEEIKNVTTGFYNDDNIRPEYQTPDVLRFLLFDQRTERLVAERFLRVRKEDDKGVYYEGYISAPPGNYKMLAYNFDTEVCIIDGYNDYRNAYVYTGKVTTNLSMKAGKTPRFVYAPDSFCLAKYDNVRVAYSESVCEIKDSEGNWFVAESAVSWYYLQVRVNGVEYVTTSPAAVSGMEGTITLCDKDTKRKDPVSLYVEMYPGKDNGRDVMYTTFSTFGRTPDADAELTISFDFLTTHGGTHTETIDISDSFKTRDAEDFNWLLIDKPIELPEPEENPNNTGGIFNPSVGEWDDVESEIII